MPKPKCRPYFSDYTDDFDGKMQHYASFENSEDGKSTVSCWIIEEDNGKSKSVGRPKGARDYVRWRLKPTGNVICF